MLKKTEKYAALSALCVLTILSACRRDEVTVAGKSPIELTAGVAGESPAVTKAVVTHGSGAEALARGTSLYMVMKSEKNNTDALYTRTIGYAQETATATSNTVKFASQYGRFWEDSHSRNSQLSVYSACVPAYYLAASVYEGVTPDGTADATTWTVNDSDEYDNTWVAGSDATLIAWPLRSASAANQADDYVASQDLCFSNNVVGDSRVVFDDTARKFGKGQLIFYHALTKITFRIKKGEGFQTHDPFQFSNDKENIVLKDVNVAGTFDVAEGEFDPTTITTGTIKEFGLAGSNDTYSYILDALLLPGTDLSDDSTDKIEFTIDNNLYHLSKKHLKDALKDKFLADGTTPALDEGKTRAGVHYIFDMTVGKKKMDSFTASVMPWESVTADETTPTNARIVVSLLSNGVPQTGTPSTFDLYRAANVSPTIDDDYESYDWKTGYVGNKATLKETKSGEYEAVEWYWPDNKTFYHFRAVMNGTVTEDATDGDYLPLTGGKTLSPDVCWGAPINDADGKISKAIGPTQSTIALTLYHMMSDVTITLTTTDGTDKVTIEDAVMELTPVYPAGKARMGSGLVDPDGTAASVTNADNALTSSVAWQYYFVPQSLEDVILTITTTDNDQYKVSMKDVTVGTGKIGSWQPGTIYSYTFKLTKTGIKQMSATLADWKTVTADENVWF